MATGPQETLLRGGTTAEMDAFTGGEREINVDTDKKTVVVQDGTTAGGFPLVNETAVQTLSNKTLITPTIASMENATHSHADAAGGGTLSGLTVPMGGTGVASTTAFAVLCGGTTSTAALQSIASVGTSGQVLTSNGPGALPTMQTSAAGDALTSNPLSQFASTTSLQLLGVMSDETGTGALVFGTSPTIVTPTIASLTNANHDHTDSAGGGILSNIPQVSVSAAKTFALTDLGTNQLHPSSDTTARTWTIDSNANLAIPVDSVIMITNQDSAGVLTIAITTDTMRLAGAGTTGSRTLAANGVAFILKLTSTEWIISGTGLT